LDLKPEIEAGLLAQAEAAGMSLELFLSRQLEWIVHTGIRQADPVNLPEEGAAAVEQWERGLDEWLDSFPQTPLLPDEAFQRENWYSDRW
jgi:hypothetical protein